ncbi:hypothetical protein AXF42_Ash012475 [Apostasia shenzhenica]|uniref:Uncharacterized protein n=1 Tax=Apostasia shenzhenica TaxID=1088818 RepID=A0A2I0AR40_9ASPA|nr:hypothetical protein AXF42_Ash012475 [Apostasia shenzhenica]
MAGGFRGMRDDFMEIVGHIIRLSGCTVSRDDDNDGDDGDALPPPAPLPVVNAVTEDCPASDGAFPAPADDGERVINEDSDSHDPNMKLNKKYPKLPLLQNTKAEHTRSQAINKSATLSSSSDSDGYYHCSKESEDDEVSIQKHSSNPGFLVMDHMPSVPFSQNLQQRKMQSKNSDDEELRDWHEVDDFEY